MAKKYVSLSKLSTFLDNLRNKFAAISHKHTISDITDYTVDSALSSASTNPVQNKVIDAEFDAMVEAMGALESAIDGKASTSHNHDDRYYTGTEVDAMLTSKSDSTHKHDDAYDTKGAANTALESAKSYTDTKTSGLASTSSVNTSISTHNSSISAHNDIRILIEELTERLNTLADSDDTTLDQMSEIVEYIKSNKELIDSITTSKVNVDDIVNNLTTNVANKPLSAAQGVAIKGLIDALQTEVDGKADEEHSHTITASASDDDVVVLIGTNGTNQVTYSASHANSGVTAGTYKSVTVNAKGHITSGTNPTTLSGYGITNAYTKTEVDDALNGKAAKSTTLSGYGITNAYTKSEIDNLELITVADIDAICGTTIQVASASNSEVTF